MVAAELALQQLLLGLLLQFARCEKSYVDRIKRAFSEKADITSLRHGYLTRLDLIRLLAFEAGELELNVDFGRLIDRLSDWGIIRDDSKIAAIDSSFALNAKAIRLCDALGLLENCVSGPAFTYAKYFRATPAIIVKRDGIEHIGTGAIVRFGPPANQTYFLVSNRHVVEGWSVVRVDLFGRDISPNLGEWRFCDTDDLACVSIRDMKVERHFALRVESICCKAL
jgi:hypothetical protein